MDETELDQIAIDTLTPLLARVLGWTGATLATAGVTVNFGSDFALKLTTIIVGLVGVTAHEILARLAAHRNQQASFHNGLIENATVIPASPRSTFPPPPINKPLTDKIDK